MLEITHLPWLQPALKQVITQLTQGNLSHALLLGIESGYGGDMLAKRVASAALCQQLTIDGACGHCKSCQLLKAGNHPDLYQVQADGNQIKIDQIRELCQKLTATAQQGGRRVAIVQCCERMNQAAANALLKTLEEPGKDTLLVLQSNTPARLIATISSRCQKLPFTKPQNKQLINWFNEFYGIEQNISWALPVTGGPLSLVELWQQGQYQTLYEYRQAWRKSLQTGHLSEKLISLTEAEIINALKVLYLVLRQRMIKPNGLTPFALTKISVLGARIMQHSHELSVMPSINYIALCQSYLKEYQKIVQALS